MILTILKDRRRTKPCSPSKKRYKHSSPEYAATAHAAIIAAAAIAAAIAKPNVDTKPCRGKEYNFSPAFIYNSAHQKIPLYYIHESWSSSH